VSEYALVIPANMPYMPGLNGILNALDYYGNTCAVEVITTDIPDAYFDECRAAFDYPIVVTQEADLPELAIDGWSMVRRLHFSRYARAAQLAGKYEAIMFLDADCGLVNNIMHQFKLAGDSGLILAAHNVLGQDLFPFKYTERHHTNAVPIANMPMFLRPDTYHEVFTRTIEISAGPGGIDDMPALFYAIDEAGALPNVVLLPDSLWLNNHFYQVPHKRVDFTAYDGRFYLYANLERVSVFHKKWWHEPHRLREVAKIDGQNGVIAQHNTELWASVYRYFNTQHKVTIDFDKYAG